MVDCYEALRQTIYPFRVVGWTTLIIECPETVEGFAKAWEEIRNSLILSCVVPVNVYRGNDGRTAP